MKYIKTFENAEKTPQLGDFVICKCLYGADRLNNFLENRIGQCVGFGYLDNIYKIRYEDVPFHINLDYFDFKNVRAMRRTEIIAFSSNKNDIEAIIQSNKYNL